MQSLPPDVAPNQFLKLPNYGIIALEHPLCRQWFWFMVPQEVIDANKEGIFNFTLVLPGKDLLCVCQITWKDEDYPFPWYFARVIGFRRIKLNRQQRKELAHLAKFQFFEQPGFIEAAKEKP